MNDGNSLKKVTNLKAVYSTEEDDLLKDFFIPCLSNSVRYDRISGFFSSILYPMIFRGIKNLVLKENSKIRLIIGFLPNNGKKILAKNDLELYAYLYDDTIINDINNQFEENEPMLKKNHLKLLGWLILNKKLEIKLGLLLDQNGDLINNPELLKLSKGKLHKKIGILYDTQNNSLSFCGSNNETPYGWEKNYEEFDIHYSWDGTLKGLPWLDKHKKKFNDYWENKVKGLITINLPNKCIEKLIDFAPNEFDEIKIDEIIEFYKDIENFDLKKAIKNNINRNNFNRFWKRDSKTNNLILDKYNWLHHKEAPLKWEANGYTGLFEMATGTGKTITSIKCIYHIFKRMKKLVCWILVPDKYLISQWAEKLEEITENIIIHNVSDKRSRDKLKELLEIYKYKNDPYNFLFFLSTTKMTQQIISIIDSVNVSLEEILLIVDEAHSLGALVTRQKIEKFNPKFKIGLTATPKRYFDPIGTQFITEYFGNSINELTLRRALELGFLCPYKYFIRFCNLNEIENKAYESFTRQILNLDKENDEEKLIKLYNLRARIIKKAEGKKKEFEKIIGELINENNFKKCLIYCDDHEQLEEMNDIIKKYKGTQTKLIDGGTPNKKRKQIIELLEHKHINAILAMKCLDQGVDIPFLKIGIFLSSSGNEKEFIQRRGRLMRKYSKKDFVEIYDIIVKKKVEKGDDIFLREKERIRLFSKLALNQSDVDLDYFDEIGDFISKS